MNLWGAAPLIAAALLSGGTGVHTTAGDQVGAVTRSPSPPRSATPGPARSVTPSPAASPPLSLPGTGAPTPVLHQVGTSWETTILLNSTMPACGQPEAAHYWLATTTPNQVIQGTPTRPKPAVSTDPAKGAPPYGSSCQVLVTFTDLDQVPETATLVVDQPGMSSAVTLMVSRNVTLTDYLVYPAVAGLVIAFLSLALSLRLIWKHDRESYQSFQDWLARPILGSGAWTVNDSWATNISTGLVVIAAVLGATTATNSLFPGVALDRFSIVNIAAGFFVVAAPVLFGILYSRFTAHHPGLTADATIKLPRLRAATISVPSGASITMAADTTIRDSMTRWATVRGDGTYQIPPGTKIQVLAGIREVAQRVVQETEGEVPDQAPRVQELRPAIEQALANQLTRPYVLSSDQPAQAIGQAVTTAVADVQAAVLNPAQAAVNAAGPVLPGVVDVGAQRITQALARAAERIVTQQDDPREADDTIATMAYSGGADIGVLPGSAVRIAAPAVGPAVTWTIEASNVVAPLPPADVPLRRVPNVLRVQLVPTMPPPPPAASDAPLTLPVFIDAVGGAKVTVTGAADVTLRKDAVISAPRRPYYRLRRDRPLLAPQGTNIIVANLRMLLTVNILTMFGIGAELGIAGVLTGFSDATGHGRGFILAALAVVAVLVIIYAATAARAMADPQPGSSISSQTGSSFTL